LTATISLTRKANLGPKPDVSGKLWFLLIFPTQSNKQKIHDEQICEENLHTLTALARQHCGRKGLSGVKKGGKQPGIDMRQTLEPIKSAVKKKMALQEKNLKKS